MADEKRGAWSVLDTIFKLATGILIPLAIFLVGNQYTTHKDAADREQRNLDRISGLIKNLASDNEAERLIATGYITFLVRNGDAPADVIPLLVSVGERRPNSPEAQAAAAALKTAEKDKSLSPVVQQALGDLPPRVFLHIREEAQREKARNIGEQLAGSGLIVPGIERVSVGPSKNVLKYFRSEDEKEAQDIAKQMRKLNIEVEVQDSSSVLKTSNVMLRPRTFELWFAPGH